MYDEYNEKCPYCEKNRKTIECRYCLEPTICPPCYEDGCDSTCPDCEHTFTKDD